MSFFCIPRHHRHSRVWMIFRLVSLSKYQAPWFSKHDYIFAFKINTAFKKWMPLIQHYHLEFLGNSKNNCAAKANMYLNSELISDFFDVGMNLPKHVPNTFLSIFFRWIEVRIVVWHTFWKNGAKVKKLTQIKPPLWQFVVNYCYLQKGAAFLMAI